MNGLILSPNIPEYQSAQHPLVAMKQIQEKVFSEPSRGSELEFCGEVAGLSNEFIYFQVPEGPVSNIETTEQNRTFCENGFE